VPAGALSGHRAGNSRPMDPGMRRPISSNHPPSSIFRHRFGADHPPASPQKCCAVLRICAAILSPARALHSFIFNPYHPPPHTISDCLRRPQRHRFTKRLAGGGGRRWCSSFVVPVRRCSMSNGRRGCEAAWFAVRRGGSGSRPRRQGRCGRVEVRCTSGRCAPPSRGKYVGVGLGQRP
jgi:hypothetical protein